MEKKTKYLIITLFLVFGLIVGSTTSWYVWRSSENTDVTFIIDGTTITYDDGTNIEGQNLRPTASKEVGVANDYAIKKDIIVSSTKKTYLSLYLTAVELLDELKHESLKWELYENIANNEILLSSGNFKEVTQGDRILLIGNTKTDDYIRNFSLYIWIDGNMENPSNMSEKNYSFTLNAYATDQKGEYQINIPHLQISDATPGVLAGSGTEIDPYLIESIEDLIFFSNSVNGGNTYKGKYISLKQTLDFSSDKSYVNSANTTLFEDYNGDSKISGIKEEVTTGQGFIPIGLEPSEDIDGDETEFKGNFFGNNNVVKNLYINYEENSTYNSQYIGIFGYVNSGIIKDLGVTGNINASIDR